MPKPKQKAQKSAQQTQAEKEMDERLKKISKNHPDCVPILFLKHPEAPKHVKPPVNPFILFKKDLMIEQAMYSIYNQTQQKGLYFFAPYISKDQIKYSFLKPGTTIESVFKKFGTGGYLTLVYSDQQLGMQGLLTMQKWMIRILIFIGIIWVSLYGYTYYLKWEKDQQNMSQFQALQIQQTDI